MAEKIHAFDVAHTLFIPITPTDTKRIWISIPQNNANERLLFLRNPCTVKVELLVWTLKVHQTSSTSAAHNRHKERYALMYISFSKRQSIDNSRYTGYILYTLDSQQIYIFFPDVWTLLLHLQHHIRTFTFFARQQKNIVSTSMLCSMHEHARPRHDRRTRGKGKTKIFSSDEIFSFFVYPFHNTMHAFSCS